MNVLFCGRFDAAEREPWWQALRAAAPEHRWWRDDEAFDRDAIEAAVVANPAPDALARLPKLRLVQSLWAGVDRLLADATLPADVPIARMVDPAMSAAMAETALWAVLSLHRRFFDYADQQRDARWLQHEQRRADEVSVLVLGAGHMGQAVAQRLAAQGYRVTTWRASDAAPLAPLLAMAEIAISLLPLTPATRGLLDARCFAALPQGASIVNLARGAQVVDADLVAALDAGHLRRAVLDVFAVEPLPAEHPFWRHPKVTLLPHVAALTDARSASRVVAANLRALARGEPVPHLVDRARGY
ncbi:MAG TPA: glyoxylate/hydroxypyruvate reductase A [Burkholderiaceae bacterium]|nr:glyoxylate/hydroxypyruvate reductase A [Burkholderiaceae bacterium]